ncbi:nucleotidyltransferase domain-containing protein [Gammaproteobacteria bacterium]|nr:nucleotidyltransferase domain-containing protein [Gammaproteobacteria bacterium]
MIKASRISTESQRYITEKLKDLEKHNDIRILLAIESGSRAWGFASQDSDYDVRFIYARNVDDYLSVESPRDVIETPLVDDDILGVPLDMNGWDIKKVLQLALKSNAVLTEWLTSPIRYIVDEKASAILYNFAVESADLQRIAYHYDRLGQNAWEQITNSTDLPRLKLYCYAIRPALTLRWIRQFSTMPPMDVYSLCEALALEDGLVEEISKLIALKSSANESDLIPRNELLDQLIQSTLSEREIKPISHLDAQVHVLKANQIFKNLISDSF